MSPTDPTSHFLFSGAVVALAVVLSACAAEPVVDESIAASTNNLMLDEPTKWTFGDIPVCLSGGTSTIRAEARSTLNNSWPQVAQINLTFPASCPTSGPRVEFQFTAVSGWGGIGGGTGGFPAIGIGVGYCDPALGGNCTFHSEGEVDPGEIFRSVVIHEFGHALGFWHEHQRADRPSDLGTWCDPANDTDPANNAIQDGTWLTPSYDPYSIMNYCRDQNGDHLPDGYRPWDTVNDRLSLGDMVGLQVAYGYRFPAFMFPVLQL